MERRINKTLIGLSFVPLVWSWHVGLSFWSNGIMNHQQVNYYEGRLHLVVIGMLVLTVMLYAAQRSKFLILQSAAFGVFGFIVAALLSRNAGVHTLYYAGAVGLLLTLAAFLKEWRTTFITGMFAGYWVNAVFLLIVFPGRSLEMRWLYVMSPWAMLSNIWLWAIIGVGFIFISRKSA